MRVIEASGLRKEFTVREKAGWLRRRARVVAAVDGIDLTVERGEMLGYIGPNGAGKSTTLKMLTGVLYPSAGQVRVCGLEPVGQRTRLARRIGVVMVVVAATYAPVPLTLGRLVLLAVTPVAGAMIFGAVFVATATVAFWWIESGEIANGLTYGGLTFAQYPMTIYGALFRRLLAYGVGFAFVAYYPTLALLDRPDPLGAPRWLGYVSPAVAVVAAVAAGLMWRTGVRHYRSTGS